MKTRSKKILCALSAATCIMGASISAYAIEFHVTPPTDSFSYAVKKNDNEQNFYVTGTSFSKAGTLYCYSQQCADNTIRSQTAAISSGSPRDIKPYVKFAKAEELYEMNTYTNVAGLEVGGRYTP